MVVINFREPIQAHPAARALGVQTGAARKPLAPTPKEKE